jgi:hypothetical protein
MPVFPYSDTPLEHPNILFIVVDLLQLFIASGTSEGKIVFRFRGMYLAHND